MALAQVLLPMFFALSGFLVAASLLRVPIPKFIGLRVLRIFPNLADLRPNLPPAFGRVLGFQCGPFFHSHFHCEFAGCDVAQRRVRPVLVVILLPFRDCGAGLSEQRKQSLVEALVAEAAVEAFDEAVLHWLAGGDVMSVDLGLVAPFEDGHAGHLRPGVRDDRPRFTASGDEAVQFPDKPNA